MGSGGSGGGGKEGTGGYSIMGLNIGAPISSIEGEPLNGNSRSSSGVDPKNGGTPGDNSVAVKV